MRQRLGRIEVRLGGIGASLLVLAFLFARTGIPRWIPPAPMSLVGLRSPLNGMTRSFVSLASGHPGAAFHWHPFGPIAFVTCIVLAVQGLAVLLTGRTIRTGVPASRAAWVLASTFVLSVGLLFVIR